MKIYVCGSKKDTKMNFVDGKLREYSYIEDTTYNSNLYCEVANLYDIAHNSKEDIIGLEHYRRFFIDTNFEATNEYPFRVINEEQILETLKDNDLIMSKNYLNTNLMVHLYGQPHNPIENPNMPSIKICLYDWFEFLRNKKIFNMDDIYHFMMKAYWYWGNNMFIGKREVILEYVNWIFPLMDEFGKNYPHQHRIFSYIGEYTFGLYMMLTHKKIVEGFKATLTKDCKSIESYQFYASNNLNPSYFIMNPKVEDNPEVPMEEPTEEKEETIVETELVE